MLERDLDVARATALLLNDAGRWVVVTFDGRGSMGCVRGYGTHVDSTEGYELSPREP